MVEMQAGQYLQQIPLALEWLSLTGWKTDSAGGNRPGHCKAGLGQTQTPEEQAFSQWKPKFHTTSCLPLHIYIIFPHYI